MKRQQSSQITSRVFTYGTVPARVAQVKNEDSALGQLRLGNRLWNVLVAIERAREAAYRKIMRDEQQERVDALKAEIPSLRDQIKLRRQSARKRAVDLGDLPARLQAAKAERDTILATLKATSTDRHAAKRDLLDELGDRTNRRIKRARQAAASMGLFWGSYNDIVQRADAGKKLGDLHFRSFRGSGTITTQIMGGATVTDCIGGEHTFFQVDGSADPGQKSRYARLRIGSNADRSPVWLEVPIVYHREIPAAAAIKSVSATRREVDRKATWQLNVTVSLPKHPARIGDRIIALDIGWRLLPSGAVRAGYWADNAGQQGEVTVPAGDIGEFKRVAALRSTCDLLRDEMVPSLAAWLGTQKDVLPEEWRRRSAYLIQWRSGTRLANLIAWWRDNRLPNDDEAFEGAMVWRKRYLHVSLFNRNLQEQLTLKVREQYRVFAASVARDYDSLVIEDFDMTEIVKRPKAESADVATGTYRQMVSPSTLRMALLSACSREGLAVAKLPAALTTRACHACGYAHEWNQSASVMHRCGGCGALWDQDFNAAMNLLNEWRRQLASGGTVPPVVNDKSRLQSHRAGPPHPLKVTHEGVPDEESVVIVDCSQVQPEGVDSNGIAL